MENTTNTTVVASEMSSVVKETNEMLKALKLSRSWLANKIGVSAEHLRKVLSGTIDMSKTLMQKLQAFNKKLEQIDMILKAA